MESVKTTTLIIDLDNTKFKHIQSKVKILEYDIPSYILQQFGSDYPEFHRWLKELCGDDIPYYYHQPSKKFYTFQEFNDSKIIQDNGKNLNHTLFNDYQNKDKAHCWLNAYLSSYSYHLGRYNNNKFYLVVDSFTSKKGYEYVFVIQIQARHHFKEKKQYELFIDDTATRMRAITKQKYLESSFFRKEIPYQPVFTESDIMAFRQLSRTEFNKLKSTDKLYITNTDKDNKTNIDFHSVNKYKQSRSYHIHQFLMGFQEYLTNLGIIVNQKELKLQEKQNDRKSAMIDFSSQTLNIINGLLSSNLNFQDVIKRLALNTDFKNPTLPKINMISKKIKEINKNDKGYFLLLMDYNSGDFDKNNLNAPLNSGKYQDQYPVFKNIPVVSQSASQGWCVNENYYIKKNDENNVRKNKDGKLKKQWTDSAYLSYEGLKDKDLLRNFEVCLNQLYLKDLLKNPHNISNRLPHYDLIKNKIFAWRWKDNKNNKFNKILYIDENDILKVEDWNDIVLEEITDRKGGIEGIDQLRLKYHIYPKADFNNFMLIISKTSILEIEELPERILYDENKVSNNLFSRDTIYPKSQFSSWKLDAGNFNIKQIKEFNRFIDEEVKEIEEISYNQLRNNKDYWERITNILNIKKETQFTEYLNNYCKMDIQGKTANKVFKIFEGIWFDKYTNQYFVGSKKGNSYNAKQGQNKGFQVRKIVEIDGKLNEKEFFPLLDVEFIRYGGYTVIPFPFRLIKKDDEL